MKVVVILPTYNEAENIGLLVDALREIFAGMKHEMSMLVVDDDSPDGTAGIVRGAMKGRDDLGLLTGEKRGLGAAYIRGMTHAVKTMGADAVLEMDADFSHDPADVPRLVLELEKGADFVIGSRYVPGGRIPDDWGLHRKLVSRWGNAVSRRVAGMEAVRDCTAGFRAIRATVLDRIDLAGIDVTGYTFQVVLLERAMALGARIVEIPVTFVDRARGTTKLGLRDLLEFARAVRRLRSG